jgi:hypothetical protein
LFAFISRIEGWNVGAFVNFEEALAWLAANGQSDALESDPRQQKVAIKMSRARNSKPPTSRTIGRRVYVAPIRPATARRDFNNLQPPT